MQREASAIVQVQYEHGLDKYERHVIVEFVFLGNIYANNWLGRSVNLLFFSRRRLSTDRLFLLLLRLAVRLLVKLKTQSLSDNPIGFITCLFLFLFNDLHHMASFIRFLCVDTDLFHEESLNEIGAPKLEVPTLCSAIVEVVDCQQVLDHLKLKKLRLLVKCLDADRLLVLVGEVRVNLVDGHSRSRLAREQVKEDHLVIDHA